MKNATRTTVAVYGVLTGVMGIEHGIGEMLQGSRAPEGLVILSWPDSAFFDILAGEPAMTIVPNLLIAGLLAILFSLAYLVWATTLAHQRHGGLVLLLLSIAMLLAGGGFGPPLLGIIVGLTATRINVPLPWRRARLARGSWLDKVWLGLFAGSAIAWLVLFPGSVLIDHFVGVGSPELFVPVAFFSAMGLLLLTIGAGFLVDSRGRPDALADGRPALQTVP